MTTHCQVCGRVFVRSRPPWPRERLCPTCSGWVWATIYQNRGRDLSIIKGIERYVTPPPRLREDWEGPDYVPEWAAGISK